MLASSYPCKTWTTCGGSFHDPLNPLDHLFYAMILQATQAKSKLKRMDEKQNPPRKQVQNQKLSQLVLLKQAKGDFDHKTATFRFIPTIDNSVLHNSADHFLEYFYHFGQEYQKGDHQEKYQ